MGALDRLVPEAPNGLAVIGWDEGRGTFLQHYFDMSRHPRLRDGVRERRLDAGRTKPADFSDFEFSQRFTGAFTDGGDRIDDLEIAHDHETWAKDFDLIYTRTG